MADNKNIKLTSVKIIKDVYSSFKKTSFDSDITLQKVVNRSLHRYINEEAFRKIINDYTELAESGSQF